jgi:hypothetical protein
MEIMTFSGVCRDVRLDVLFTRVGYTEAFLVLKAEDYDGNWTVFGAR